MVHKYFVVFSGNEQPTTEYHNFVKCIYIFVVRICRPSHWSITAYIILWSINWRPCGQTRIISDSSGWSWTHCIVVAEHVAVPPANPYNVAIICYLHTITQRTTHVGAKNICHSAQFFNKVDNQETFICPYIIGIIDCSLITMIHLPISDVHELAM